MILKSRVESTTWKKFETTRHWTAIAVGITAVLGLLETLETPFRPFVHKLTPIFDLAGRTTAPVTITFLSLALIFTARGLRLGHRIAWLTTLTILTISITVHLLHKYNLAGEILPMLGTIWIATQRNAFAVRPDYRTTRKATLMVLGVTGVVMSVAVFVSWQSPGPHDLDAELFSILLHLTGFTAIPLTFGYPYLNLLLTSIGLLLISVTLWLIFSPRAIGIFISHRSERERARRIVNLYGGGTLDYFALRDDKRWFFHGDSLVAYAVTAGVCLVSPDPIGPKGDRQECWSDFMEFTQNHGWAITILGASEEWLPVYKTFKLHPMKIGEEAIVNVDTFTLEGPKMKSLRQGGNRLRRNGYTISFHNPLELTPIERAEIISLAGLSRVGNEERGFSMTLSRLFMPGDTDLLMSIAKDENGKAQAFVQWVPAPGINGWSLDVMRRNVEDNLPNGVMDLLITETISYLKTEGKTNLALNFAVLRNSNQKEVNTIVGRVGSRALELMSGRTEIDSLAKYNEKFHPEWQPRYIVFGHWGSIAKQSLAMASAEGLSELPIIGRFMKGIVK